MYPREVTSVPPYPLHTNVVSKKSERKKDNKNSRRNRDNGRYKRLHRLPKAVLHLVCEFLSFEAMFACAGVSKKMARKFRRMLTSYKQVPPNHQLLKQTLN